ncbi:hypothetical protein GWI34_09700 [Actinomadura sp. DSM 109109]|nr:hypothetical protein [Actinomadura lepetitiana]
MHFETSIAIDAPPETVWSILEDVEHWPDMTASIERVEILNRRPPGRPPRPPLRDHGGRGPEGQGRAAAHPLTLRRTAAARPA